MYVATVQGDFPYVKLLLKFFDITTTSQPKPAAQVKHNTEHHIKTRGPPVFSKARILGPERLQTAKLPGMDTELFCDVSTGRCRPSVPKEFRRRILETLHNLSQQGVKATVKLVGDRLLWPGYKKHVAEWTC
ncbi:hypothetical protein AVEN_83743-1 [Araneus ventricosus]|uniref:Integrase zinc-binding domain-containing protein n=1 Tax=Araneus ventricosus TaxID=182803 RepID=A0A4Y2EX44_ARAVE|nr:hypothetical protein AVEN_83743-1 [Araneus ventricosus]